MLQARLKPIRVKDALERALAESVPLTHHYSVGFSMSAPVADDLIVMADEDRLALVLTSLFSNGAKGSSAGSMVSVLAKRAGDRARISVRDYGRGICEEVSLACLRGAQENCSDIAGCGLDLAGAQSTFDGEIICENTLGQGSTTHVYLPTC